MKNVLILLAMLTLLLFGAACGGSKNSSGPTNPADAQPAPTVNASDPTLQQLRQEVEGSPSVDGYLRLGNAYSERALFSDAVTAYQKGLTINPNHPATLANLGVALYQLGQYSEAKAQFAKALTAKPDDAATTYLLGATYLQMHDEENAELMFKKALTIDPTLPEAHFGLGTLYAMQKKNDLAIKEFETFLAGPPAQDPRAQSEAKRYLSQLKSGQ